MNKQKTLFTYSEYLYLCKNFETLREAEIILECLVEDMLKFHPGIIMELNDMVVDRINKYNL